MVSLQRCGKCDTKLGAMDPVFWREEVGVVCRPCRNRLLTSAGLKNVTAEDEADFVPATDTTPVPEPDPEATGAEEDGENEDEAEDEQVPESDDTDGFFPTGLDTSGVHPVAAPLGPTPWLNYTKSRRLRGADDYPLRVLQYARGDRREPTVQERAKALADFKAGGGVSDPQKTALRTQAGLSPSYGQPASHYNATSDIYEPGEGSANVHPHPDDMSGHELIQHLKNVHLLDHAQVQDLISPIKAADKTLNTYHALHQVHHEHHAAINNGQVDEGSWVPHLHQDSAAQQAAKQTTAPVDYAQTGSVMPKALTDFEHALMHGSPEHPTFPANVPDALAHHPGFHHLVQHHGLNPNHPDMHAMDWDKTDPDKFVQNWTSQVHGGSDPVSETYLNTMQGNSMGHHGLVFWNHGTNGQTDAGAGAAATTPPPAPKAPTKDANQTLAAGGGDLLAHPMDMSPAKLAQHLKDYHAYHQVAAPHADNLAEHEGLHGGGHSPEDAVVAHTHKAPLDLSRDTNIGAGGEWLGSATLPQTTSKEDVLAHLNAHHPNVDAADYNASVFHTNGGGLAGWHQHLHSAEGAAAGQDAPDQHTHVVDPEPTQIAVGKHLVDEHGYTQEQVAAMKPHEFKAAHERAHGDGDDEAIGHSHAHPGGPVTPPRTYLVNPEYVGTKHEHTFWHGASSDYSGAPLDSTTKRVQTGLPGTYDNDWNTHVGSHWATLHQFAKEFANHRVIAAKIRMKNPKYYDNLNHMAHDAYDRLRAIGEISDDTYDNNHKSSQYGACCSGVLSQYAHGGAGRTDGKRGMQKFRDSLRAEGHDGILVRNHADEPHGAMNAIVFSPHDVEISNAHCQASHGDDRDNDKSTFTAPSGWDRYTPYQRADHYPSAEQVAVAAETEKQRRAGHLGGAHPDPDFPTSGGSGSTHYVPPAAHSGHDDDEDEDEKYCSLCDQHGHDNDDDDEHDYCSVCDTYGHQPEEEHPYCDFCDEHTTHESDEHEDQYGEHPHHFTPQDYCPTCGTYNKEHREEHQGNCVECGAVLPDVNKTVAHGTPRPGLAGKTYNDAAPVADEPYHTGTSGYSTHLLAHHLKTHHGSDLDADGRYNNGDGEYNHEALEAHHDWLHLNPQAAAAKGFPAFEHTHAHLPDHPRAEDMSPEALRVHLQAAHHSQVASMSHQQMLNLHQHQHDFGAPEHDYQDYFTHSHGNSASYPPAVHPNSAPKGKDAVLEHLGIYHGLTPNVPTQGGEDAWTEALHEALHAYPGSPGISAGGKPDHEHTEHGVVWTGTPNTNAKPNPFTGAKPGYADQQQWEATKALAAHLVKGHGKSFSEAKGMTAHGYANALSEHLTDHLGNYQASAHNHHEGSGALHDYLTDIHSHLGIDHGIQDPDYVSDPHGFHAKLHALSDSGIQPALSHSHHQGQGDHQVPDSLNPGSDPDFKAKAAYGLNHHEHLSQVHGWTPPPNASEHELAPLHQFWHAHPEHAVAHGNDIDHAHTTSGPVAKDEYDWVGPQNANNLHTHLQSVHHDLTDQVAQVYSDHGYGDSATQALHELHQSAHASGQGLAAFHTHKPDPHLPLVDDPSINDLLAKHLHAQHGWSPEDFTGKANTDLIEAHHQAHHSLDPHAPYPGHIHTEEEYQHLHANEGVQPHGPVSTGHLVPHLLNHHGFGLAEVTSHLTAAPSDGGEVDMEPLHDWHANLHADPTHTPAVAHEHPFGHQAQDDPQQRLVRHLIGYHGYTGRFGALAAHPDLPGLHASLHDSPELHDAPAFGLPLPHHHGDLTHDLAGGIHQSEHKGQMLPPGTSVAKPAWQDMSQQDKRDHLIHHHGIDQVDPHLEHAMDELHQWHHDGGVPEDLLTVPHTHLPPTTKTAALDVSAFFAQQMEPAR